MKTYKCRTCKSEWRMSKCGDCGGEMEEVKIENKKEKEVLSCRFAKGREK